MPNAKIESDYYIKHLIKLLGEKWLPKLYLEGIEKIYVHHDAAPSHVSRKTTEFLTQMTQKFESRFITKDEIPFESLDASPLDFSTFAT